MKVPRLDISKATWGLGALAVAALAGTAWAWQNPRLLLELMSQAWSCF